MKKFLILILSIICALSMTIATGCLVMGNGNTDNGGNNSSTGGSTDDDGGNTDDDGGNTDDGGGNTDDGGGTGNEPGGDDGGDVPSVGDFTVKDMYISLTRTATVQPTFTFGSYEITYESDNETVVSVNGDVLTAVSLGTANITATPTNGVASKTFAVTVVTSTFTVPEVVIEYGCKDKVVPVFEIAGTNLPVTYSCADSGLTIAGDVITGNTIGTYTATAQTSEYSQEFTVKVKENPLFSEHLTRLNGWLASANTWKNKEDLTLLAGDSFMDPAFLDKEGFFTNNLLSKNVETIGVWSTTAEEWYWLNQKYDLSSISPKNLVLHIGSNDVFDNRTDAETSANYIIKLLENYHELIPNTNVYWLTIAPRIYDEYAYDGNAVVASVNDTVQEYAVGKDWLTVVDYEEVFLADIASGNSIYYSADNVHPRIAGYVKMFELAVSAGLEIVDDPYSPIESASNESAVDYSDAINGNLTFTGASNLILTEKDLNFVSGVYTGGCSKVNTSGFYIYMSNDDGASWSMAFVIRYDNNIVPNYMKIDCTTEPDTSESMKIWSSYPAGSNITTTIAVALDGGKVHMLYKWGTDEWKIFKSFDNNYGKIWMVGAGSACQVTDLTLSKTVPSDVDAVINQVEFDIPNLLVYQGYYVKVPTLSEGTPAFSDYNGVTISDGKVYAGDELTAGDYTVKATIDGYFFDTFTVTVRDPDVIYGSKDGNMNTGIAMHNTSNGSTLAYGAGSSVETHKSLIDSHSWDEDELMLFFGDSFTDINWFFRDFYSSRFIGKNVETVGISSSRAEQWIWFIQELVLPYKPKTIVSHIGTNDIFDGGRSNQTVITSVTTLFDLIHEDLPETEVWWWTIEDRCGQSGKAGNITAVNNGVSAWASDKDWFHIVDTRSIFVSNDSTYGDKTKYDSSLWNDSIHPSNPKGYDLFMNATYAAGCPQPTDNSKCDGASFAIKDYTGGSWQGENLGVVNNFLYTATVTADATHTGGWRRHVSFNLANSGSFGRFLILDQNKDGSFGYYTHINGVGTSSTTLGNDFIKSNTFDIKIFVNSDSAYLFLDNELRAAMINVGSITAAASIGFQEMSATISNQMIYGSASDEYKLCAEWGQIKALETQYASATKQSVINISSKGISDHVVTTSNVSSMKYNAVNLSSYVNNFLYTANVKVTATSTAAGSTAPHISFNLGSYQNRFLIQDDNKDGNFHFLSVCNNSYKKGSDKVVGPALGATSPELNFNVQILVTDDSAYLYVNGTLRNALINMGSLFTGLSVGCENVIGSITGQKVFASTSDEYSKLFNSTQIQKIETDYATTSVSYLLNLGLDTLNDYYHADKTSDNWNALTIANATTNFLYTSTVTVDEVGSGAHIALSFNQNAQSRYLIWDNNSDGKFKATMHGTGWHSPTAVDQYDLTGTDKTLEIAVLVIGSNAYLFIDGELVCAYIYVASSMTSFSVGMSKMNGTITNQKLYQSTDAEYTTYTAKSEIANYQNQYASSTTTTYFVDLNV